MTPLAKSGVTSIAGYGTDWLYLFVPLAVSLAIALLTARRGTAPAGAARGTRTLLRAGSGLSKATGLPAHAAVGVHAGITALLVAALGFYWDVAWHVDYGRDDVIFTPAHTAILVGLQGLVVASVLSILVATWTRADVALVGKRLRSSWGAVALGVLGVGAVAGFPLDEFWHRSYGVDVTMWGPTHITMIGGGSFAPLALLLLVHESRPRLTRQGKALRAVLCSAVLIGLSTFQLEFDLGVPQWQQLFHPVLIAIASGVGLVVARRVLGPGGALVAAFHFNVQRLLIAGLLGNVLHHVTPRWALYLGTAVLVEIAMYVTRHRSTGAQAVASGVAVTLGLGIEWAWTQVMGRAPWGRALVPAVLVAVAAAFGAAVLGTVIGRALRGERAGMPGWALALAGVGVVGAMLVPFPRHATDANATIRTAPAGEGRVDVTVTVDRPEVVENADWWQVFAWQGGHFETSDLVRTGPAEWRTERPIVAGGPWKTMVRLANRDVLVAAPVSFPADEEIGASEIPLVAERTAPLDRDTKLLMREARAGKALPAVLAYTAVLLIAVCWLVALALGLRHRARNGRPPLAGTRVVMTGTLGGIGLATARGLREAGATVVGIDLVEGPDVIAGDVTSADSMRSAVAEAAGRLGGIDVVVNLAGIGRAQDAGDFPDAEARRVLDVNLFGTWNATAAALPWLVRSEAGHVVVTASGLAVANVPWAAAYAASKRAVSAYADTLRIEYDGRLSVTVVNPGYVRTPIHEVPAASGASLEGLVPADEMGEVVAAYVRACAERPRSLATSTRTSVSLWFAKHLPVQADAFVLKQVKRMGRPEPGFVLSAEQLAARAESPQPSRR